MTSPAGRLPRTGISSGRNPALGNRVWATFTFLVCILTDGTVDRIVLFCNGKNQLKVFRVCVAEPLGDVEYVEIELSTTEEEKDETWQVDLCDRVCVSKNCTFYDLLNLRIK